MMSSEQAALWLSAGTAAFVGVLGVTFALLTGSQAILLDGLFNAAYFVTALLTLRIADLIAQPDTDDFPFGFIYFEPLINGVKGVMILGISLIALVDAVDALFSGGRQIGVGLAIVYAVLATATCSTAALLLRSAGRRTGSPLVVADAASWMVNALVSGAVLLTFCAIIVIEELGFDTIVPYVDPALVAFVVLISVAVPIRMAWEAITALLNRAPPPAFRKPVVDAVHQALADVPTRSIYVRMIRPGRTLNVAVHVVVAADFPILSASALDRIRTGVDAAVRRLHQPVIVDVLFTADERWAAPAAAVAPEVMRR